MPKRYFIRLSYNGSPFHGWQSQPNAVSVQETLEKALSTVLRSDTKVVGAGRTDTGVNARMMIAHFDADNSIAEPGLIVKRLNSIVGKDIAIHDIFPVHDDAHSRFDAVSRTYKYFIHSHKSPFLYPFSWYCSFPLNFDLMNEAAKQLLKYNDFTSFSKLHTDVATNNCKIKDAVWTCEGEQHVFTVTADRFLRNMVRAIVGTLVEVGREKITVADFCRIIELKDRCRAGTSMPGNALFLWSIEYPYLNFEKGRIV